MRELGHKAQVRMWLDAAGARERWLSEAGKGAIKHMVTKYFWEKLEDQSSDLMTKHLDGLRRDHPLRQVYTMFWVRSVARLVRSRLLC